MNRNLFSEGSIRYQQNNRNTRYWTHRSAGGSLPSRSYLDKPFESQRRGTQRFIRTLPPAQGRWYIGRANWDPESRFEMTGDNLSILRIFTNFWLPSLSMYFLEARIRGT